MGTRGRVLWRRALTDRSRGESSRTRGRLVEITPDRHRGDRDRHLDDAIRIPDAAGSDRHVPGSLLTAAGSCLDAARTHSDLVGSDGDVR